MGYFQDLPELKILHPKLFNVNLPKLKILRIVNTGILHLPNLNNLQTKSLLHMIDLENNAIGLIRSREVFVQAEELVLNYNRIVTIESYAFNGSEIARLKLRGNRELVNLDSKAFAGLKSLRHIDLSETKITTLPTEGLHGIEVLRIQETESLQEFPSIYNFEYIKEAWLTYPCHCCAFQFPQTHNPTYHAKHKEFVRQLEEFCSANITQHMKRHILDWHPLNDSGIDNFNSNVDDGMYDHWDTKKFPYSDGIWHDNPAEQIYNTKNELPFRSILCGNISKNYRDVKCVPKPDPFNPCEDLMGTWWLRISVWIVALLAIFGNMAVALVLITSKFRMSVSRFLMCNLSIADMCMGFYLLLLAIIDARSVGVYFNHAIYWQNGYGCRIAGFISVFGNVLSIYTLAVITCERWYTITWAIHLNRRLKLRSAMKIMLLGWIYAFVMAVLPLNGISNYSKTSICLPLEHHKVADTAYLSTLLGFNFLAFLIICICYARMYSSIKDEGQGITAITSTSRSDFTVAKRMALLVFTDFACLAPIGFFGLTALAGYPLITVTQTKIILVFIYPLNSCANPYLYALLTQQYRRDLFILLGRYGLCKEQADRCKGAIGGVPLPKGSAMQYKRRSGRDSTRIHRSNNIHQHPCTMMSMENLRSYSLKSSRPTSVTVVPEFNLHTYKTVNYNFREFEHVCQRTCHEHNKEMNSAIM
ncbi:lutropin-choriogonadotropic hormone receptor-like [Chrysoperla carnea]|uniref:lutropin-choriogonadotropic hormone receptor-like n=1 Tax=Chrysoperla carnea TaxID=189513 RepID=UPI001D07E2E9|nr:lutropin-choriogonadotropic hormone receptor-like [Chrysoperla carnea]